MTKQYTADTIKLKKMMTTPESSPDTLILYAVDDNGSVKMTSADPSGNVSPITGSAKFIKNFSSSDWSSGELLIPLVEHNMGSKINVQVYESAMPADKLVLCGITINNGDITLMQTTGDFTGYAIIV